MNILTLGVPLGLLAIFAFVDSYLLPMKKARRLRDAIKKR
jgi:hypothetical protein